MECTRLCGQPSTIAALLDYPTLPTQHFFFCIFFHSPGRVCAEARTTQLAHKLNAHQRLHTRLRRTRKQALGDDTWRWLLSGKSHALLLLCKAAENTQFAPKNLGTPSMGRRARSQEGVICATSLGRHTARLPGTTRRTRSVPKIVADVTGRPHIP